jgi:hypothetical protein
MKRKRMAMVLPQTVRVMPIATRLQAMRRLGARRPMDVPKPVPKTPAEPSPRLQAAQKPRK